MPHLRLSYSADIFPNDGGVQQLLAELAGCLAGFETLDSRAIKAYATAHREWAMGDGAPTGFVHCEVAILSGRPVELRKQIGAGIAAVLRKVLPREEISLTVEIREMDRETYSK